ncbi:response regulator [candidate division KSB1 bacterium]|nr:response regulator [candidate division KSB1 bacterium]
MESASAKKHRGTTPSQTTSRRDQAPAPFSSTILVIDDEDVIQKLNKRILEAEGFRVLTAHNGRRALEIFQRIESIDLVMLDLIVPDMGGETIFHRLKQIDPGIKVLLLSGESDINTLCYLIRQGAVGFIQKPYTPDELLRLVKMLLF